MDEVPSTRFIGECAFLRYWPSLMVVFGLWLALNGAFGVAVFLVACGTGCALTLPWRYRVFDDGLALQFAFGKRRFLPREEVVVRVNRSGGVVHHPGRRFGYPLSDRLVERRTLSLRAVLAEHGYRVA